MKKGDVMGSRKDLRDQIKDKFYEALDMTETQQERKQVAGEIDAVLNACERQSHAKGEYQRCVLDKTEDLIDDLAAKKRRERRY
jgi:hypothetical protein